MCSVAAMERMGHPLCVPMVFGDFLFFATRACFLSFRNMT